MVPFQQALSGRGLVRGSVSPRTRIGKHRLFLSMNEYSSPAIAVVILSLALSHGLRAQARKPPEGEAT
jgi:hypothetical protein